MGKIAILYYHRIDDEKTDYNFTNVQPKNFEKHMRVLRRNYDIIPIRDLMRKWTYSGDKDAVVVTFDDGYANVLYNAVPIMEVYDIPFTCFISTENIETGRENWTDIIVRSAFEPEEYHDECILEISNGRKTLSTDKLEERVNFYREIRKIYNDLKKDEKKALITRLMQWAGFSDEARDNYRIMNSEEIRQIRERGGEIGVHTVTHPFLSFLEESEIEWELSNSKQTLESVLSEKITLFSYPFGDCPRIARPILDGLGYEMAVTSNRGLVSEKSDLMYLPRYSIRDYSEESFEEFMKEYIFGQGK